MVRDGGWYSLDAVRALGEERPAEFFRVVVEGISDSFDPAQIAGYEQLMRAWLPGLPKMPAQPPIQPQIPAAVETVYVLSRVTLGADIKITSMVLSAMKRVFPDSAIVLVGGRKCAELFAEDSRIRHLKPNIRAPAP